MTQLRGKVVSGFFWTVLQTGLSRAIGVLTTMVLLLYLSPRDFGVLAAALVVTNIIEAVSDGGLSKELVFRRDRLQDASDTAFVVALLLNLGLFGAVLLAMPLLTRLTGDPEVTRVVAWMSVGLVLSGCGLVARTLLQRHLMFREIAFRDIAAQVLGGVVSVGMAMTGFGVASLVGRQLAGALAGLVLVYLVTPYRPRLRLDLGLARTMMGYGQHMVAATLLSILVQNVDRLVSARIVGVTALGFYSVGLTLVDAPYRLVSRATSQVLFPVFALLQGDRPALARAYLRGVRATAATLIPACVALALLGPPILDALYGGRWATTGELLPLLSAGSVFWGMTVLAGEVFKATGHPRLVSSFALYHLVTLAVLLVALGNILGLTGIALASTATVALRFVLEAVKVSTIIELPPGEILKAGLKPLFCSLVAFGPASHLLRPHAGLLAIIALGLASGVVYAAGLWLLDRRFFLDALDTIRPTRAAA
jgi:polysaccharide transporter, PST family